MCSFLQGFQQVRRSHDGIVLTLASITRLVVQVSRRYYFFYVRSIITLPYNENSQNVIKRNNLALIKHLDSNA